jgi:hypothetical protein
MNRSMERESSLSKKQNYHEAEELCKCLKIDIYYHMTGDAQCETFDNHMEMLEKMESHTPREPYKLSDDYETKDVKNYGKSQRGKKRVKQTNSEDSNSDKPSYAKAVTTGKKQGLQFSQTDANMAMMQNQIKLLQENQRENEKKMVEILDPTAIG